MWDAMQLEKTMLLKELANLTKVRRQIELYNEYILGFKAAGIEVKLVVSNPVVGSYVSFDHDIFATIPQNAVDSDIAEIKHRVQELNTAMRDLVDYQPCGPGFQNVRNGTQIGKFRSLRKRKLHAIDVS